MILKAAFCVWIEMSGNAVGMTNGNGNGKRDASGNQSENLIEVIV